MPAFGRLFANLEAHRFHRHSRGASWSIYLCDCLCITKYIIRYIYIYELGGRCFLPQAPRSYPIPMAHRVTPGHPEVTPGTKSYWHTSTTPPLVWQTKYVKCVRAIATHIFNTISFGDKTMLKVGKRHWHTRIDSETAAFHTNEKSSQFCSTRPVCLS